MTQTDIFRSLGLTETTLPFVQEKGFEIPSPIQSLTIPALLSRGGDIIAQAQTGTGKTAAFGLPLIEMLERKQAEPRAIILVPTRELALQVTDELISFNGKKKLSISAIYGGASISEQLRRLKKGIDIVVATPGRCLDHIRRGTLDVSKIEFLVLDEADEMLNMGFIEDIEEIMAGMDAGKRVMLFSATMPQRIVALSKKYMSDPELLKVEAPQLTTELTDQIYFEVREGDKLDALTRIIDIEPDFYGIVFSRTKVGAEEIANKLLSRGYASECLHGDVSQAQREKILRKFRDKKINILVATDVAARGIDINNLTHVINYSLPQDSESYVHRIGRTGRAGNHGTAITFISPSELRQFGFLRKDIKVDIKRETLPTPQDIVSAKRNRVKEELQSIIESGNFTDCQQMAGELLETYDPNTALSALLRLAFKNELSEASYPEIRSFSVDRRGKARVFIAVGKMDGYDPRKMIALIKRECGLPDSKIDDLRVMENYTFVTVPYSDAEYVVRQLNQIRKGKRPIAELAKDGSGQPSEHSERPSRGRSRAAAKNIDAPKPRKKTVKTDEWYDIFSKEDQSWERTPKDKGTGADGKKTRSKPTAASGGKRSAVNSSSAGKSSRRAAREQKRRR